jgi:hypothetical protein
MTLVCWVGTVFRLTSLLNFRSLGSFRSIESPSLFLKNLFEFLLNSSWSGSTYCYCWFLKSITGMLSKSSFWIVMLSVELFILKDYFRALRYWMLLISLYSSDCLWIAISQKAFLIWRCTKRFIVPSKISIFYRKFIQIRIADHP